MATNTQQAGKQQCAQEYSERVDEAKLAVEVLTQLAYHLMERRDSQDGQDGQTPSRAKTDSSRMSNGNSSGSGMNSGMSGSTAGMNSGMSARPLG